MYRGRRALGLLICRMEAYIEHRLSGEPSEVQSRTKLLESSCYRRPHISTMHVLPGKRIDGGFRPTIKNTHTAATSGPLWRSRLCASSPNLALRRLGHIPRSIYFLPPSDSLHHRIPRFTLQSSYPTSSLKKTTDRRYLEQCQRWKWTWRILWVHVSRPLRFPIAEWCISEVSPRKDS